VRVAILLAGLVLSLVASTPAAGRSEFFGVDQGARPDGRDFRKMAATGLRTERFLLTWGSVEPSQGSFRWGATDRLVGGLASHGIRAVPALWGSPAWVAPTPAHPPIDSVSDRQGWQAFLAAAVARYGPGGSYWVNRYHQQFGMGAPVLPIRAWQVWVEPNGKAYFAPTPSAKRYARLLGISRDAIKGQDPRARVVLAGLVGLRAWDGQVLEGVPGWRFLRNLYQVPGIRDDFDIAAFHPYAPNIDQLRRQMKRIRAVMSANGDGRTALWITELGWGSAPPGSGGSVLHLNKGIQGQKRLLIRSFRLLLRHRRPWHVQRLFWYDWRDPAKSGRAPCSFCRTAGLLRHNRKPKPAYYALRRFTR
jgi:hypothetical protein